VLVVLLPKPVQAYSLYSVSLQDLITQSKHIGSAVARAYGREMQIIIIIIIIIIY